MADVVNNVKIQFVRFNYEFFSEIKEPMTVGGFKKIYWSNEIYYELFSSSPIQSKTII